MYLTSAQECRLTDIVSFLAASGLPIDKALLIPGRV
jgi:hypothetical protein